MNRQEIIEGLEHCIKNDRYPGGDCAKCPLYPAKGETDACVRCIDNLMHNAAWLLRQDAPERNAPLALEDAGALPRMGMAGGAGIAGQGAAEHPGGYRQADMPPATLRALVQRVWAHVAHVAAAANSGGNGKYAMGG